MVEHKEVTFMQCNAEIIIIIFLKQIYQQKSYLSRNQNN